MRESGTVGDARLRVDDVIAEGEVAGSRVTAEVEHTVLIARLHDGIVVHLEAGYGATEASGDVRHDESIVIIVRHVIGNCNVARR